MINYSIGFRNLKIMFMLTLFSISLLSTTSLSDNHLTNSELETQIKNADLVVIYDNNANLNINIDGNIGANEYPESFYSEYVDMTVGMVHNGSHLFVGMSAPTSGYVAVGFNQENYGMVGADIKFGYIKDNVLTTDDYFGKQYDFPTEDPSEESDIGESAGNEINGVTTIEFVFPFIPNNPVDLKVNTKYGVAPDMLLEVNKSYALLYAWGTIDSMSLHHKKSVFNMFIAPEGVSERTGVKTSFEINFSGLANKDTYITGTATLKDESDFILQDKKLTLYLKALISDVPIASAITDSSGSVSFNFTVYQEYESEIEFVVKFEGDLLFKKGISDSQMINYHGEPEEEFVPHLVFPADMDYLVPYITGIGAILIVISLWMCFFYVFYTVLFLNYKEPNLNDKGGNEQ